MKLHIDFKNFLSSDSLVKQEKIPCVIQIGDNFNILFFEPLPEVIVGSFTVGTVVDWDRWLLDKRAPGRVGGCYTHHEPGMITLKGISKNTYQIYDLYIFSSYHGWHSIIEKGEYATPINFSDNDEDDPVYMERIAREKKLKEREGDLEPKMVK